MSIHHEFKNGKVAKKKHLALSGIIFGLCTYPVLPLGLKFFSFIIPVVLLSVIWSSKYDNFNIHVFFICLFFSFLLPSNAFIFDARNVYGLNDGGSNSAINFFFAGLYNFLDIACIIIMAIPIFLIVTTVYSALMGNASKATTGFARVLMVVGFTILVFFIFDFAGIELGGMTGTILEFYTDMILFMLKLPLWLYDLAKLASFGVLPDLPSGYQSDLKFDMSDNSYNSTKANYNSMSYADVVLTISDLLPIFAIVACFLTFLLFNNDERAERIELWLTKLSADYICPECESTDLEILENIPKAEKSSEEALSLELLCNQCNYHEDPGYFKKEKSERQFYPNVDFSILIVFGLLLLGSFLIFLSYSNYFRNSFDSSLMWRYIGFFGVYLPMATIPLLLMLFGKVHYKRSNLRETTKGIMYGYFGLWLLTRLFFTRKVMSAYSAQGLDVSLGLTYLLEQCLYVGPAETLFFTVFGGALVSTYLLSYTKENLERGYEENRITNLQIKKSEKVVYAHIKNSHETDLAILDNDIKQFELALVSETRPLEQRSLRGKVRKFKILREKTIDDLQKTQMEIRKAEEETQTLKNERDVAIISEKSIFGRGGSAAILIIFGMFIPAFIAASAHSLINLNRVDYISFWTSGFGVYYFAGFVWFSFLYFTWGWKPAVIVHILFNISDILLFLAFMGV